MFRRFFLLKSLEMLALVMAFVGICGVVVVVIFSVCFGLEIALGILICPRFFNYEKLGNADFGY